MIANDGDQSLPSNVKRYVLDVASRQGRRPSCGRDTCRNCPAERYCAEAAVSAFNLVARPHLEECLDGGNEQLQFSRLALLPAWDLPRWTCGGCGERTLHSCAGVCPRCRRVAMRPEAGEGQFENYFLWLAEQDLVGLRAEEAPRHSKVLQSRGIDG